MFTRREDVAASRSVCRTLVTRQPVSCKKKKMFGHFKADPYVMPNGQKFFAGSRDLLVCTLFVPNPETPARSTARDTARYTH